MDPINKGEVWELTQGDSLYYYERGEERKIPRLEEIRAKLLKKREEDEQLAANDGPGLPPPSTAQPRPTDIPTASARMVERHTQRT